MTLKGVTAKDAVVLTLSYPGCPLGRQQTKAYFMVSGHGTCGDWAKVARRPDFQEPVSAVISKNPSLSRLIVLG